jgi:hypothetical protein
MGQGRGPGLGPGLGPGSGVQVGAQVGVWSLESVSGCGRASPGAKVGGAFRGRVGGPGVVGG